MFIFLHSQTSFEWLIDFPFFQAYPDYFTIIKEPIALSILRKRSNSGYYKTVLQFRDDYRLMFNNARKYNQEGSWVYVDAEEMEKVFNAAWDRTIVGSDLPGAPLTSGTVSATGSYASALTPMDDDDRPPLPTRGRSAGRKQVISDEEYLTPSDDEWFGRLLLCLPTIIFFVWSLSYLGVLFVHF